MYGSTPNRMVVLTYMQVVLLPIAQLLDRHGSFIRYMTCVIGLTAFVSILFPVSLGFGIWGSLQLWVVWSCRAVFLSGSGGHLIRALHKGAKWISKATWTVNICVTLKLSVIVTPGISPHWHSGYPLPAFFPHAKHACTAHTRAPGTHAKGDAS